MTLTVTHKHLKKILDSLNDPNQEDFIMELRYSTLIAPAGDDIPYIQNRFILLFTDIYEFDKFNSKDEYRCVPHEFNDYLEILTISDRIEGFIINPDSEKFILSRDFLEDIDADYIFEQDYLPFTVREIIMLKNSIDNSRLNDFIADESNRRNLEKLTEMLNDSTLLTLLISDENQKSEDGVVPIFHTISKCIKEVGNENYLLLFSRDISADFPDGNFYIYSQILNFPLAVKEVLNSDFDGFILNIDDENITVPRECLRDFMKGFSNPLIDDYSAYSFTISEEE